MLLTIGYSTRKIDENFLKHIKDTVGLKENEYEIIPLENNGIYGLSEAYNIILDKSKSNIVVLMHDDIIFNKNQSWGQKIINDFKNDHYGIIGKAGSCYMPKSGVYWEKMQQTMVGEVYHLNGDKKYLSKYSINTKPELIDVVTIDGLFIAVKKNKIKHRFDETIGKFHFYDHAFCIPNYLEGIKIGVTFSFDITHKSVGKPNEEFFKSKDEFTNKYENILPINLKPTIQFPNDFFKEVKLKKTPKISIIIPTKGKLELLFGCIRSIISFTNYPIDKFNIYIADTGSNEDEIIEIKNFIKEYRNIILIEYDYYNFAKINNDVVINHIKDDTEFLLFCNNDIVMMTDCLSNFIKHYEKKNNLGTIGARLHFADNTIQHGGIIITNNKGKIGVTHNYLGSYYNYKNSEYNVVGNTGGFLMIRKKLFEKIRFFNENYLSCFEDVELNINTILNGYENICDMNSVCYHFESQSRNDDKDKMEKLQKDWFERLQPFIIKNYNKLNKYIINIQ